MTNSSTDQQPVTTASHYTLNSHLKPTQSPSITPLSHMPSSSAAQRRNKSSNTNNSNNSINSSSNSSSSVNITMKNEEETVSSPTHLHHSPTKSDRAPLMVDSDRSVPSGNSDDSVSKNGGARAGGGGNEFYVQALKFMFCFVGLQVSYLTWGYMQELIMTTTFEPTASAPDGKFPSAAFCVFSNRFLAIIVAIIAVRIRHGAVLANNSAPLVAFAPCALSNTMSSWSQYASLRYVSFPVQTVFKSSKIIPVMIMGKVLKGTSYPLSQYVEAFLITVGVAIFSVASKSSDSDTTTEIIGLLFMCMYVCFDCFTSQWQDKIYVKYGRANVDPYQMMLGVNSSAIIMTTAGLIINGDIPKIIEFFKVNPSVFQYNVITAITSASGQLFIYTTIKEFGPIVFTVIMTTRQMISICISSILFGHSMTWKAAVGATLVFGVLFYQIRKKYMASKRRTAQA